MSNHSDDTNGSTEVLFSQIQDEYVAERYYQCLGLACDLFTRIKDDQGSRLNNAVLEFIGLCALHLKSDRAAADEGGDKIACSFCGKSSPEVRLGAGPSAFICNECVGVFSDLLK
ncbi:MAG: ClpX C4-type zinc finger protein [Roseiarcus sp.]|jgi:hypothetical protein